MDSIKNLKNFWSNKKVFITGHTGFKGSWLSIIFNSLNSEIHGYSLKAQKNTTFHGVLYKNNLVQLLRKLDAMFLCYYEIGTHPVAPVNSHKILEFLALL